MQFVLGGNRVGSGKKMRGSMSNYNRSTHNLSEKWASSMASGILYPAMCKLAMRGDAFDITINADCRTIPTQGPLFGTYKMQVDVYQVPIRLYQALLHNNPLAIGMKMSQVCFPQLMIKGEYKEGEKGVEFSNSCLLKYLGMSGLGATTREEEALGHRRFERGINAIPALAYYDIFKTYYANKQEDKAYVISTETSPTETLKITKLSYTPDGVKNSNGTFTTWRTYTPYLENQLTSANGANYNIEIHIRTNTNTLTSNTRLQSEVLNKIALTKTQPNFTPISLATLIEEDRIEVTFYNERVTTKVNGNNITTGEDIDYIKIYAQNGNTKLGSAQSGTTMLGNAFNVVITEDISIQNIETLKLVPFELTNIDDMRYDLLSFHQLGTPFVIKNNENAYLPYKTLVDIYTENEDTEYEVDRTKNSFPLNGLVLKTYQNDIYNNWLNTDWIEGENGITELTKVQVDENGRFSMDALNFAEKLYTMLNRVVVTDGTYESWQDTMYEEVKRRQIESPIFCGGISQEVVFDEIVQTAPAGEGVLGTLGGRGRLREKGKKGGKLHIKCDEACFIIALVSLTPRQYVTQGNEFYLTDVMTMDDIHKPAMDGIGFQDLIGERLAYWDSKYKEFSGQYSILQHRSKIGKLPAWIEYMTSVDRAYGDFAKIPDGEESVNNGAGFMILNRNYEYDEETGGIKDATTYVDPQKYNYAFARTALDAQNFWVQINFGIEARRLMSARLMPNV